ncbi:hypothetical protein [Streptomyces hydrogenans]|uniref:hypothetical protein n=1 Tax=Streptomyces hydrogenans TaxID=1873719 RepID=UPI0037F4773E
MGVLTVLVVLLLLVVARFWAARRMQGRITIGVALGGLAAAACTGYSADGSWRFAADVLGMTNATERILLFGAAELAMLALVMMARENLNGERGVPGAPGVLIKVVTGVQVVPAVMISPDFASGTVRAFFGPILAALLWHLVLDIDLRAKKPAAESKTLVAILTREARERLFAHLGLAQRDRTAIDIAQDHAVHRAARRIQRFADMAEATRAGRRGQRLRRRIAGDLRTARISHDPFRRAELMSMLAHTSSIGLLADKEHGDPWAVDPDAPEARQLAAITRQQMRDAVKRSRSFRPAGMLPAASGEPFKLTTGMESGPDGTPTTTKPEPKSGSAAGADDTPTPKRDDERATPIVGPDNAGPDTPTSALASHADPDKYDVGAPDDEPAPTTDKTPTKALVLPAQTPMPGKRIDVLVRPDGNDNPDKSSTPDEGHTPTKKRKSGRRTRAELLDELKNLDPDEPTLSPNYVAGSLSCSWATAKALLIETGRLPNPEPAEGE